MKRLFPATPANPLVFLKPKGFSGAFDGPVMLEPECYEEAVVDGREVIRLKIEPAFDVKFIVEV